MPGVLIFLAGRCLQIQNPNFFYLRICQQSKQKQRNRYSTDELEVKLRAVTCCDIEGQRVALNAQVTCLENICQNLPFNLPQCFFMQRVVEMIVLPESMYRTAFLSLEFHLSSELVSSVAKHKFNKFMNNSCSTKFI